MHAKRGVRTCIICRDSNTSGQSIPYFYLMFIRKLLFQYRRYCCCMVSGCARFIVSVWFILVLSAGDSVVGSGVPQLYAAANAMTTAIISFFILGNFNRLSNDVKRYCNYVSMLTFKDQKKLSAVFAM